MRLLAICHFASASPCKPVSSSGSLTLSASSIESSSLPAVSSSTPAGETELSTTFITESTAVSETATATSETEAETDTSTILITTSSAESTTIATSSVEPTTTTTSIAEPTNVLVNPGFESASVSPWRRLSQFSTFSISDEDPHSGVYSGYFYANVNSPILSVVDHPIDPALITVNQQYIYSIWIKTTDAVNCEARWIACGSGGEYIDFVDWAVPYNQWTQFSMTCTWSQLDLILGPSIQIRGVCQSLGFYIDDAVVVEAN
ncbi:hypothetical protein IL306_014408 [Fusarium sp. DS 682]|nr:hypothetical protein IL306_014408 [Fusarium sp. DS 682]